MQSRLADARRLFFMRGKGAMSATIGSTREFREFEAAVARSIDRHPIVSDNAYTRWFARGEATLDELRDFTVQFSVFSHLFIEAQLRKCINAPDLASYRAGKEILLNELGVTFARRAAWTGGRSVSRPATSSGSRTSPKPWAWSGATSESAATDALRRSRSATR